MTKPYGLATAVLILLAIFLSRAQQLNSITFDIDEVRSAMRAEGDISQIIAWQPDDWPPLYGVMLGSWRAAISDNPLILRSSSLLLFMLATALVYRMMRVLFRGEYAALGAMAVFGALGYNIFLSLYLRPYVLAMALFPLVLWLTVRYFNRPTLWRAILPGLALGALFYTTYTAIIPFALLGLYTLMKRPRAIWRWGLPVLVLVLLAAPELLRRFQSFSHRVENASSISPLLPSFGEGLIKTFREFGGTTLEGDSLYLFWFALFIVAVTLLVLNCRRARPIVWWGIFVTLSAPVILYVMAAIPLFYFYVARYVWWGLVAVPLVIGAGLRFLPRVAWGAVVVVMLALMFRPAGDYEYRYAPFPFEQVFSWLHGQVEEDDVLLFDKNFCLWGCGDNKFSEEDMVIYYYDQFADGIPLVKEPGNTRRVWYLSQNGWQDPEMKADVETGRVARQFAGPWNFLLRLYEAPPDPQGVLFSNGLRFHGLEIVRDGRALDYPISLDEQETVHMRLWWSVDHPLDRDYSISVQWLRGSNLMVAADGAPQLIHLDPTQANDPLPAAMTEWKPGQLYVEERDVTMPPLSNPAHPTLYLTVYQWWDGVRLLAPGVNSDRLLPVTQAIVWGW